MVLKNYFRSHARVKKLDVIQYSEINNSFEECWLFEKTRSWFNRAFNFFPECNILNRERTRLIGFSFARQDWFLKKRSRKTSYRSTNKFFWCPDSLVANILVRQNKAKLLKFIWNVIIVARLAHICSITEIHLISTLGEAIADGVMALRITDFFIVILNVSGFFPGPGQYFHQRKNSCNFFGIIIQESNCQMWPYVNWWLIG